jgi:hypothetical protein
MSTIYDLYINQGSDFSESIDITGDYTGYTIRGKALDSTNTLSASFIAWTDDTEGQFDMTITNTVTATMSAGTGHYDVEVESPTGSVSRILQGRVYVDKEVTV